MSETVQVLSDAQLTPAQKAYFAERYSIECEIDDLKAEHIAPLNEDLKALKGKFKAESGIDLKVSNALYALYKLDRSASRLQEKDDEDKRRDDLQRAFKALAQGQQLDWIKASDEAAGDPLLENPDHADGDQFLFGGDGAEHNPPQNGDEEGDEPGGPAGLTFSSDDNRPEGDPLLEETQQAWADTEGGEGGEEDLDKGGFTFAAGKKAGSEGAQACQNPHGEGNPAADLWARGHAVGLKEFIAAESARVAEEHEAEESTQKGGAEVVNLFEGGGDDEVDLPPPEQLAGNQPAAANL